MPSLGPMVYRSAKLGAALLLFGVLEFVAGMAVAQYLYPYGSYSLTQNYISDLGNSNLGSGGASHALVFNLSIMLLGFLALVGSYLIRTAFPRRTAARLGIVALGLAGISAFLVGTFPENYHGGTIHGVVSATTFFFSGLALVFLSIGMIRDTRWSGFRTYTLLSGLVTWVAMVLFVEGRYLGLGPGGMERVIVAPILLWGILAGAHLLRLPTFRSQPPPDWSSPSSPS